MADVIYAIRNGGFSGAIMPQNIVVGADADKVAAFVAKYAGQDVVNPPAPQATTTTAGPLAGPESRATLDLKQIRERSRAGARGAGEAGRRRAAGRAPCGR